MLGLLTKKSAEVADESVEEPETNEETGLRRRRTKKRFTLPRLPSLKKQPKPEAETKGASTARVMMSTQHNEWIHKAVTAGVIAAIACGPIAVYKAFQSEAPAPAPTTQTGMNAAELNAHDQAGAFGVMVVSKWLTATRDTADELSSYFAVPVASGFSTKPLEIADPTVVSATKDETGLWSVVVAAGTKSVVKEEGKDDVVQWSTRHYELPVRVSEDGSAIAQRAPSIVPTPLGAEGEDLAYGQDLDPSGAVSAMAGEFLTALLADGGDVSRLTTPGSTIHPVDPAPFTNVTVSSVAAVDSELENPTAGDSNQILVTAVGTTSTDEAIPLQYTMTILSRDGRWEVEKLVNSPELGDSGSTAPAVDEGTSVPTEPETTE